jgi:hypothetical protein
VIPQLLIEHSTTELNALQTIELFQKAVSKAYIFNASVRLRTAARSATEQWSAKKQGLQKSNFSFWTRHVLWTKNCFFSSDCFFREKLLF